MQAVTLAAVAERLGLGKPAIYTYIRSKEDLLLAMPESTPYAEVNPDRRLAMLRMATLAHLAAGRPWRVLVVPRPRSCGSSFRHSRCEHTPFA